MRIKLKAWKDNKWHVERIDTSLITYVSCGYDDDHREICFVFANNNITLFCNFRLLSISVEEDEDDISSTFLGCEFKWDLSSFVKPHMQVNDSLVFIALNKAPFKYDVSAQYREVNDLPVVKHLMSRVDKKDILKPVLLNSNPLCRRLYKEYFTDVTT